MEEHGRTWKNMEEHGRTWKNMEEHASMRHLKSETVGEKHI